MIKTVKSLCAYYWDFKAKTIEKVRVYGVSQSIKSVYEKHLHDRMVRARRLVSNGKKNAKMVGSQEDNRK